MSNRPGTPVVCSDYLRFQLRGQRLANKDGIFGKSDPFYTLNKVREDGSRVKVFQSEVREAPTHERQVILKTGFMTNLVLEKVVMDNLSPTWRQTTVSVRSLCNG
jgi:hypothetical protein